MKFAAEKHFDQKVKGSEANYLLHISNVVMEVIMAHANEPTFDLELAIQIGALHDVLEDVEGVSAGEIEEHFSPEVLAGVMACTKSDAVAKADQLTDSISRIKNCGVKEAAIVKLADRITNLQPPPSFWSATKVRQYLEQAKFIQTELGAVNGYMNERIQHEMNNYSEYVG